MLNDVTLKNFEYRFQLVESRGKDAVKCAHCAVKRLPGECQEDNDFDDVTLVFEDGQLVKAHKVILIASNPFFQKLILG